MATTNVSLVFEDGEQMEAHKVILDFSFYSSNARRADERCYCCYRAGSKCKHPVSWVLV